MGLQTIDCKVGKAIKKLENRKVALKINGTQHFLDGSVDEVTYETQGSFYIRGEGYHIAYEESKEKGMQGIKTLMRIEQDKITLHRWGEADLKQQFQRGVMHHSLYQTKQGVLKLSIFTKDLEHSLTADGGHIRLEYDLFLEENLTSHNTLAMKITLDGQ